MTDLPKRNDDIYKKIENFEDYEFTNCIAYEMAIRNERAKQIKKEIDIFESENDCFLHFYKGVFYNRARDKMVVTDEFKGDDDELLKVTNTIYYYINLEKELNHNYLISLDDKSCYMEFKKEKLIENGFISYYAENDFFEYDVFRDDTMPSNTYEISTKPKYKNKLITRNIEIDTSLNLNLPKDELIAYISRIKDEYDNDKSIIKSPLELLNQDLEKADNNPLEHKTTKKINKFRVADMFYIYDCDKLNIKKSKIINELNYYYYDKNFKDTNFTYDTLNKYLKYAKSFIDNLKYKELITGAKITN